MRLCVTWHVEMYRRNIRAGGCEEMCSQTFILDWTTNQSLMFFHLTSVDLYFPAFDAIAKLGFCEQKPSQIPGFCMGLKKKISLSAEVIQVLEIFFLRGLNVLYLNFKAQSKSVFSFSFSFSFFFAFRPHTLFWVCTISYLNQSGMKWWV